MWYANAWSGGGDTRVAAVWWVTLFSSVAVADVAIRGFSRTDRLIWVLPPPWFAMLSVEQFQRARRLASRLAGLDLYDRHRELLGRRSRRAGIRDAAGWDDLLGAAEAGEKTAARQVIALVTTKFTGFFRHAGHFEAAARHAVEAVRLRGRARLWSAAAATGEEPWSLAMVLIETFGREDLPVEVLATDVDEDALAVAARGEYDERALAAVAPARRERFFDVAPGGRAVVGPAARRLVTFRPWNLVAPDPPGGGPFDVIFCRNALMYLEASLRPAVLARLADQLTPDGLLLLDPTEHLGRARHLFEGGADGLHRLHGSRTPASAGGRGGVGR